MTGDEKSKLTPGLYVALIHSPVVNRAKEIVTSSVTNLDLHDIARAGRTFGVRKYFVVHPSPDQHALNRRIIGHWQGSYGSTANPTRGDALELVQLVFEFDEVLAQIRQNESEPLLCVGTSARRLGAQTLEVPELQRRLKSQPVCLVFGTAYGLSAEWESRLDYYLPPIVGPTDYNHLSVRSAVSIYLDRLCGV